MPTYGQAHFIRRALESVFAQTFERWELIVVLDGDDDGVTLDEIDPYTADARVRVLTLPANVGLGAALNAGLDVAAADLVA